MICKRNLKIWARCRMFDYKKKLQNSRNENRKGFATSKLCNLFTSGKKNYFIVLLQYFMTFKSKCETNDKSCFTARAGKIHLCLCDI